MLERCCETWTTTTLISAVATRRERATQLAQLADPRPADTRTITQLGQYKQLDPRWTDWKNVTDGCRTVAVEMAR
jgi:hypothetical protein